MEFTRKKGLRILVLDGGGMRGVATVTILKILRDKYGVSPRDFDIIAGTSAGGLIALSVLMGLDLEKTEELFIRVGRDTFVKRWYTFIANRMSLAWAGASGGALPGMYPLKPYLEKLDSELKQAAQHLEGFATNQTLKELGDLHDKPKVFVVATDVTYHHEIRPHLLRSYTLSRDEDTLSMHDFVPNGSSDAPLITAAVATSAAPYYFDEPVRVGDYTLVDGGVGFNNPILLAVHEAKRVFGWSAEVDAIVSIGTGLPKVDEEPTHSKTIKQWGATMVNVVTSGDLSHTDFQLIRPLLDPSMGKAVYARFSPPDLGSLPMDDARPETIEAAQDMARRHMEDEKSIQKASRLASLFKK